MLRLLSFSPVRIAAVVLCLAAGVRGGWAQAAANGPADRLLAQGVTTLVFAERSPGRDPAGHYYANFGYSCCDPNVWLHGADGGRLCKLDLRSGKVTALLDDPAGAVRDPQVHYDATKVLFSYRKGPGHHYNLYEIDIDGSNLHRLTDGPWDDVEPTYLPDGDVIFSSTRCKRYIGCWLAPSATLHRCDANGLNMRMLSSGAFTENTPAVLPDGRVLYTRWEYVNRDPVSFHHLWTINPDGTGQMVYFGNMHPGGVFIDARPIAGADTVVCINSPGHGQNEHAGYVALLNAQTGPDDKQAMKTISRTGDFRDPYPILANAFLAASGNQIVLMDEQGRADVLYTGKLMVHEPQPVRARPREAIIPPKTDPSRTTGTLVLADVYIGRAMEGVERGAVKKLLILEDLPKPVNFHGGGSQPIGHGVTSTLKRILGTVPVEPDGSACFEVPAMRSVYFALLDNQDRSIKQMRSFVTVQPGETFGCVGCHEQRTRTSHPAPAAGLAAMRRQPSLIQPIYGVPSVMEFPRDVQPVLDRYCVGCHRPGQRDGGVSLVGDHGPVYSMSYYELLLHWQVKDTRGNPADGSGRQPGGDPAYQTYSSASALMRMIDGSHYDVRLTPDERRLVRLWIDSGVQYPGTYAALGTGQVGGCWENNRPIRVMADDWPSTAAAVQAVQRRCGQCHSAQQMPQHVTARIPLDEWGDMLAWTRPLSRYSRHRIYNLTGPDRSLILMTPLAKQAGGYAEALPAGDAPQPVKEDRTRPPRPVKHPIVFRDANDPDYRLILTHVRAAAAKLDEIKRFDMPGFVPSEHYVREMKRYGVLPASLDPNAKPIDVYATDEGYWRLFWHHPNRP